jgi:glycosyltransferase involved in cell wall biosynthesis
VSQPQAWLIARRLRRRGFTGVFVNRSHGLELRVNHVVPEWQKTYGIPDGRFPLSLLTPVLRRLLESQWPAVAAASDGIILPCEDDRECLLSCVSVPEYKVRVIHHGVPAAYLQCPPRKMTAERSKRLLHVGQFSFFKGPHIVAQVANRILSDHSECSLTWVCSTRHHDEVRALLDQAVLPQVQLVDWRPQDELMSLYDRHGIFLYPSFYEGAGKACLEAMSRGLCVVTSNTSGMRDYIHGGHNGMLLPVGHVDSFVGALRGLLADLPACLPMSANARTTAERFSWDRCATEATEFYRQILERKRIRAA